MPAFRTVFYYRNRVIIFRRWFVLLAFVSGFLRKHLSAHRHYKITLHHVTSRSINTICDSWKTKRISKKRTVERGRRVLFALVHHCDDKLFIDRFVCFRAH